MDWARLSSTTDRLALDFLGSVEVVTPWNTGRGFLNQNSELVLDGQVVMVDFVLNAPSDLVQMLDYSDVVTVGNRSFTVTHKGLLYGDGGWANVPLQPIEGLPVPPSGGEIILDGNI